MSELYDPSQTTKYRPSETQPPCACALQSLCFSMESTAIFWTRGEMPRPLPFDPARVSADRECLNAYASDFNTVKRV